MRAILRRWPPEQRYSVLAIITIVTLIMPLVWPGADKGGVEAMMLGQTRTDVAPLPPGANGSGLQITLSEGAQQLTTTTTLTVAPAEPLPAADTAALLERLPPLQVELTDTQEFRLPEQSLPPPRPGVTVEESFPPTETIAPPAEVESGPLEVLRFAPEGEITIAPFLNVTFNQPMVALGTLAQLSSADVPVQLTPDLPGVWKWLGTKTLSFEYQGEDLDIDRFPKATIYTATVPAGTQSATGGVLAEDVTWSFTTPPPALEYTYPTGGPQPTDPLLFIRFDQAIQPDAVLETVTVTAGGKQYPVRLATQEELAASRQVQSLIANSREDRWIAFRSEEAFPNDTTVTINVGPGTPSAEGPLITTSVQSYSFTTFAPLLITEATCGYGDECPPFSSFYLRFNNPLDESAFDPALVTVEPTVPGLVVSAYGNTIEIRGNTQGRTTYNVTVSGELQDLFGQTLGQDESRTFQTGPAQRVLAGPNSNFVTLDPSAPTPVFTVYTINYDQLRVRIYRVTPGDWPAYLKWQNDEGYADNPAEPPFEQLYSGVTHIETVDDTLVETNIDLSEYLSDGRGHLLVWVDYPSGLLSSLFGGRDRNRVQAWVQSTQIGLDAIVDRQQLLAWATSLQDGASLSGVELSLAGPNLTATSAEDGTARFDLGTRGASSLVGRLGDDVALLPSNMYYYYGDEDSGWRRQESQDQLRWYVFDDRQMYKPGEEVHVKGWARLFEDRANGGIALVGNSLTAVQYTVSDPQGNQIAEGAADVNDLGGFDFNFALPENVNLGNASIYLSARGAGNYGAVETYYGFQIQEFRRPEFSVTARNEDQGPFFVGDEAVIAVNAQYFAGGPLPNAETTWSVSASPSSYSPPNWPDFTFGKWIPWWFDYGYGYASEVAYYEPVRGDSGTVQSYQGKTDATGTHYLRMQFDVISEIRPYSVMAEGAVMDVNRQSWAASTSLLVHPSSLYVGLRSTTYFVEQGEPLEIESIVTDIDGNAIAGVPITMTAARLEWKYAGGRWAETPTDPQECVVDSAGEPVTCTFDTAVGGEYRISAIVRDSKDRPNLSEMTRWVSGGQRPAAQRVEQEEVTLIPDKESYQPGDTAQILIQSPFSPAEGLATISRGDILSTERFTLDDGTYTLQVPIEDAHIPNLTVQIDLNGAAARLDEDGEPLPDAPLRPAYATGRIDLPIPPQSRTLKVEITPEATALEPGAETALDLVVTDAAGQPVENAELAVVVVDEAILALTNYSLANPVASFYSARYSNVSAAYTRGSIVLASPQQLAENVATVAMESVRSSLSADNMAAGAAAPSAPMPQATQMYDMAAESAEAPGGQPGPAITIRSDFNPLAVFAPAVRTDVAGQARVEYKLPDNLTRYRVMVVAVAGGAHFGSGEANVTARLPLMVRPSAPRFLNFGDRFELPVVLQNQTDEAMEVQVALEASNLKEQETGDQESNLQSPGSDLFISGLSVSVPANDRVEVRFPVETVNAGTVRAQFAAAAGDFADAARLELPVYTPATTEAFAVYGVVDEGAIEQPVTTPEGVFPQFGGLEINTSSTALSALTDAVLYLISYRFECSEQLASRILGVSALRDVLTAFQAEGLPSPAAIEKAMERDIARLQTLQNDDGGWPIWERGDESVPYYSIHVAHALQRARLKGYAVPEETMQRALDHLRNIEAHYPDYYSEITRHTLSSYAVYVRALMGDVDPAKARDLLNQYPLEEQSLEAVAWLWQVLSDDPASTAEVAAIRQLVNNSAVETAGAANFTTSYGEQEFLLLHSNRRTDGIMLDALINDEPESDLIPKVVNGLLADRTAGRWDNTQENAFILLALDRYFNTFEAQTPDFVARIWLGDTYVAEHEFEGRTTETRQTLVPMDYLMGNEQSPVSDLQSLIISKEGDGRLYYRLGLRYAPTDLEMPPLDMGFVVQRSYEPVDSPEDVTLDENGVWHMRAGARVRVRINMVADNRRYHVALVDPLPAGLEIINPALATSESIPTDPNEPRNGWWWWRQWFDHQNLRDERAEAFTTLLWDGVYEYSYVARATTPGEFVVPPAKAEEMYSPEVFGRSAVDRVIVE